jgi:hypothetical protein
VHSSLADEDNGGTTRRTSEELDTESAAVLAQTGRQTTWCEIDEVIMFALHHMLEMEWPSLDGRRPFSGKRLQAVLASTPGLKKLYLYLDGRDDSACDSVELSESAVQDVWSRCGSMISGRTMSR